MKTCELGLDLFMLIASYFYVQVSRPVLFPGTFSSHQEVTNHILQSSQEHRCSQVFLFRDLDKTSVTEPGMRIFDSSLTSSLSHLAEGLRQQGKTFVAMYATSRHSMEHSKRLVDMNPNWKNDIDNPEGGMFFAYTKPLDDHLLKFPLIWKSDPQVGSYFFFGNDQRLITHLPWVDTGGGRYYLPGRGLVLTAHEKIHSILYFLKEIGLDLSKTCIYLVDDQAESYYRNFSSLPDSFKKELNFPLAFHILPFDYNEALKRESERAKEQKAKKFEGKEKVD